MNEKKRFKPNKAVIITALVFLTFLVLIADLWLNPKEESIVEEYELIESDDVTDSIRDSVSLGNNELNQLSQ